MKKLYLASILALTLMGPFGCGKNPVAPAAPAGPSASPTPVVSGQITSGMSNPIGIALDGNGNVYVTDGDANAVLKYDSNGNLIGQFTAGGEGTLNRPFGVAVVSDGLYVVDAGNRRVQKMSLNGTPMAVGAPLAGHDFSYPLGIGVGPDVKVYVSDIAPNVWQFDPNAGATGLGNTGNVLQGQLSYPIGVAFLNSDVYVADYQANKIVKFNPTAQTVTSWGQYGTGAGMFSNPTDVETDQRGNVYVVDSGNGRIQEFDANGGFIRMWGNQGAASDRLSNPLSVAVSGNSLYVTDNGHARVVKYTL